MVFYERSFVFGNRLKELALQILPNNQPQTLLSTSGLQNGSYTRLAQAVNLLSRVFRHISSSDDALRIDLDIITQLEKTLFALEHLTSCEELESQVICCCSIATCYRLNPS